jgi:hypothetical protein
MPPIYNLIDVLACLAARRLPNAVEGMARARDRVARGQHRTLDSANGLPFRQATRGPSAALEELLADDGLRARLGAAARGRRCGCTGRMAECSACTENC